MSEKKHNIWTFTDRLQGDKVVWIIVLMLLLISIVCMFSSTSRLLNTGSTRVDLVKEQCIFVAGGFVLILFIYKAMSIKILKKLSSIGFIVSLFLLAILDFRLKTPFIRAIEINKAWRIVQVGGFQVHIMEVVKVAMVLYLAWAMDAIRNRELPKFANGLSLQWQKIVFLYAPFLVVFAMAIPAGNSGALFVALIMYIVILLGGGNLKDMLILAAIGISAVLISFGIYKISDGKYMERIGTAVGRLFDDTDWEERFLNASKGSKDYYEALDEIRQPVSAKIAIKEGGIIGKGPGQSTQRYVVPSISEDYMYSFIIEEYGLFGGILVIFLYVSLLARGSIIVRNCGDDIYAKLSVAGLCLLITLQAFLHMFVNADIGPMTGQTLPLISHGASAFICFCVAFGVILSISRSAVKRIAKETKAASPLVEHEEIKASLEDLDAFESSLDLEDEIKEETI